ncbi:MAG: hypothetical protein ABSA78_03755 [Candidatus Sulfotelmatobacter sp.]|jgi:hypothetical protein
MSIQIRTMMNHFYLGAALNLAQASCSEGALAMKSASSRQPQALVVGAITCAVSFLEVSVNSLFEEDSRTSRETKFKKALRGVWSEGFDRRPVLAKYQIALALAHVEGFSTDRDPYQSAETLISLRNFLAHPKRASGSDKEEEKLVLKLRSRFDFRELDCNERALFPEAVLSPKCAAWAVSTAARFVSDFDARLPVSARAVTIGLETYLAESRKLLDRK